MRLTVDPVPSGTVRPRLSVAIPTYNNREFVPTAVASVMQQSDKKDIEVFVMDDASPEGDPLAGSEWDGLVSVYRQPKNVGHTRNLTDAITRSVGRYVHVLHGDDFVFPGFYATALAAFDAHPSAAAVFCQSAYVNAHGQWIGVSPPARRGTGVVSDLSRQLTVGNLIQTPSIIVARWAYEELGAFDTRFSWTEDWEMWARIAARYSMVYVDQPLAAYRSHGTNSTSRHVSEGSTGIERARTLKTILSYLPFYDLPSARRASREVFFHQSLYDARSAPTRRAAFRQLSAAYGFSRWPKEWLQFLRACMIALLRK